MLTKVLIMSRTSKIMAEIYPTNLLLLNDNTINVVEIPKIMIWLIIDLILFTFVLYMFL